MIRQKIFRNTFTRTRPELWICLFLVLATLAVFSQVRHFDFINFDDHLYLTDNLHVQDGLSRQSLYWAFTAMHASNWHPLTWLSHMLDVQLYGMNPGSHHLTNLQFHIANTLLLFFVLTQMTGALWRSAAVAVLFALHPLHVESVVWIAERKDVLSTFFWMLTMLLYIWYVRRPAIPKYLAVLLCFSLGLMSKPMIVTAPIILLLLDYWPLDRFQGVPLLDDQNARPGKTLLFLVCEKIPFFILSAASSFVTIWAQQKGGALSSMEINPINARIANALVSYAVYIRKMVWPIDLAILYPYPSKLSLQQTAVACFIILSISFLVFRVRLRQPYLVFGWLWYLVTLVPVIGLVQVGSQAMADRYTYVPLIGLFIMIIWGIPVQLLKWRLKKVGLSAIGILLVSTLMAATWVQVRYWKSSITLYEHTLEVNDRNSFIHNNLGVVLATKGMTENAIRHYNEALQIDANFKEAHYNLGKAKSTQGRFDEAIRHYTEAIHLDPGYVEAHINVGNVLAKLGRINEAIRHYAKGLQADPYNSTAFSSIKALFIETKAAVHYQESLTIDPDFIEGLNDLAIMYAMRGDNDTARLLFSESIAIEPKQWEAYYFIAGTYARQKKIEDSICWVKKAVKRGFNNWDLLKTDKNLDEIRVTSYYRALLRNH